MSLAEIEIEFVERMVAQKFLKKGSVSQAFSSACYSNDFLLSLLFFLAAFWQFLT
jgi:hypothetical protein